ncbi:hypothetical protein [Streptomyces sp. NPDC058953]|uniref:hypothetical protein n=1 Tax=unclassified Streptomyces TaxID=2593676 RepID=UPI003696C118
MGKTARLAVGLLLVSVLTACGLGAGTEKKPPVPVPSQVPEDIRFASADEVLTALVAAGIDCKATWYTDEPSNSGSRARCTFTSDGKPVDAEISVFNTAVGDPARFGNAIDVSRRPPYRQTLVAGANWMVRVKVGDTTRYAKKVAEALRGVVLPPLRDLPDIPDDPRYGDLDALADAMDRAVGCTERKTAGGVLRCRTKAWKPGFPCAEPKDDYDVTLIRYGTVAERRDDLLMKLAETNAMWRIATAGNWLMVFRHTQTRDKAVEKLGAAAVDGDDRTSDVPIHLESPCDPDHRT